ncbi:uncharacterized protein RCC_05650 [Ramularia collo-cygni]|uniref:BTB domain-containing protein n=1 Tax=Ramularia collo-cygni TaxID=112498 RepID=A0A2D3VAV1_9PEZI|nr:uncharacterized protein RCC_05650 [Ramularia collo-cygni]CZT19794.1 uncharacterized protein RCC_05650 [Ramularia collo-cygni]
MSAPAREPKNAAKRFETASVSNPIANEERTSKDSIVDIDARGDLILCISHDATATVHVHRFRVSSGQLKATSKYFSGLLQGRFGESEQVGAKHVELRKQYDNIGDVPAAELPIVRIDDIGRISAVKSIEALCTDFLSILHDLDTPPLPPVTNIANWAIVADRFDALTAVGSYVRRKKMLRAIDGKTAPKVDLALSEEKIRQRLLVAILLDYPPWTEKYSLRMVVKGWIDREIDETSALWWDLPMQIEEELAHRRYCILETIQSLEHHFIKLYTSRERQCRLGYDSSAQCDSFQLGEMVRFFSRIGTASVRGTILDDAAPSEPFQGDLNVLIDLLKQAPEYQIDSFHHHCGLRTKLIPLLDMVNECLAHVGICQECWSQARVEHSWMDTKKPLLWRRQLLRLRTPVHQELHNNVRAVFTAVDRDWSA